MRLCHFFDKIKRGLILTWPRVHVPRLAISFGMHANLGTILSKRIDRCVEAGSRCYRLVSVHLSAFLCCAHSISCLSLLCVVNRMACIILTGPRTELLTAFAFRKHSVLDTLMSEALLRIVAARSRYLFHHPSLWFLFLTLIYLESSYLLLNNFIIGVVVAWSWCSIPLFGKFGALY